MKHTTKRRAFTQRAFPISITSLLRREVANRLFVTAPAPYGAFLFYQPGARLSICIQSFVAFSQCQCLDDPFHLPPDQSFHTRLNGFVRVKCCVQLLRQRQHLPGRPLLAAQPPIFHTNDLYHVPIGYSHIGTELLGDNNSAKLIHFPCEYCHTFALLPLHFISIEKRTPTFPVGVLSAFSPINLLPVCRYRERSPQWAPAPTGEASWDATPSRVCISDIR